MTEQLCKTTRQAVLLAYPEEPEEEAVRAHLAACPECRAFAALQKTVLALPPQLPHPAPTLGMIRERSARRSLHFWRAAFQWAAAAAVLLAAALPLFWFGAPRAARSRSAAPAVLAAAVPAGSASQLATESVLDEDGEWSWDTDAWYAAAANTLALNWDDDGTAGWNEQDWMQSGGSAAWQIDLSEAQQQLGKVVEL